MLMLFVCLLPCRLDPFVCDWNLKQNDYIALSKPHETSTDRLYALPSVLRLTANLNAGSARTGTVSSS